MRHIILNFETLGCTETQLTCLARTPTMCHVVDTIVFSDHASVTIKSQSDVHFTETVWKIKCQHSTTYVVVSSPLKGLLSFHVSVFICQSISHYRPG